MPLISSRSAFEIITLDKNRRCGQCNAILYKGQQCLSLIKKKPRTVSYLCNEQCRIDYDDRFWRVKAKSEKVKNK